MKFRLIVCSLLCVLFASAAWSGGGVDSDTGDRENYVLNSNGQTLIVNSPSDNAAGLERREADGTRNTIVTDGQSLGSGTLDGIGSNPHMNADGIAAFQAVTGGSTTTGIFTGTPTTLTTIAETGDTRDSEIVCKIEPFPLVNSDDDVFWGTTVRGGNGVQTTCQSDGTGTNGRKGIYRFTPPSTHDLLVLSDWQGSTDGGDTVTAPGAPFGTATYDITDVHLISHGGDAVTSSGNALVTAWLDPTPPGAERKALLYVTDSSISLVAMDDGPSNTDSPFDHMSGGVANNNGLVMFKAGFDSSDEDGSLNLWTSGGGMSELVASGDPLPIGSGTFNGFPPHHDLNDRNNAAFTAGLQTGASCDEADPINGSSWGSAGPGNSCRGVYLYRNGQIREVARSFGSGPGAPSETSDFRFKEIGSVAILAEDDTVFFVASTDDPDPVCGGPGGDDNHGDEGAEFGELQITGVFAGRDGLIGDVIKEGDVIDGNIVTRLFTPMPELRQHDGNDTFVVRAWLDTDGNCQSDTEQLILAEAVFATFVIPVLGPWGMWLMVGFLALIGAGRLLRRG